jgi:hypothetical protein
MLTPHKSRQHIIKGIPMFYSAPTAFIIIAVSIVLSVSLALNLSEGDPTPKKIVIAHGAIISLIGSLVCGGLGVWLAGMVGGINGLIVFLVASFFIFARSFNNSSSRPYHARRSCK